MSNSYTTEYIRVPVVQKSELAVGFGGEKLAEVSSGPETVGRRRREERMRREKGELGLSDRGRCVRSRGAVDRIY